MPRLLHLLPSAPRTKSPIIRLLPELLGRQYLSVAILIVSAVLAAFSEAASLALIAAAAAALVTEATAPLNFGPIHLSVSVATLLLVALSLSLLRMALQGFLSYIPARISANVQATLRLRLFSQFLHAPWSIQSLEREGHLQDLLTNQTIQATQAAIFAANLLIATLILTVFIATALFIGPLAALLLIAAVLFLFLLLRPLTRLGTRQASELSAAQLDYASDVYSAIGLAQEIKVFAAARAQEIQLRTMVDRVRHRFFHTQFLLRLIPGIYQGFVLLLLIGGLACLYAIGHVHLAALGAVVLLLLRASTYGQQLQASIQAVHQFAPFVERLLEAETRYRDAYVPPGDHDLTATPSITFSHVNYSYIDNAPVLRDLTFEVTAGETIGIIGPSGAGKSTLVQLLLGLRQPTSGSYLLDGHPLESLSLSTWHSALGYVPQEPRLLSATVADNISFFRDLDPDTITHAAQLAGIHNDVVTWKNGYETLISERMNAISGGQRQRICLARALATSPLVLVLDEPTSALDSHSEYVVQQALSSLSGQLTIFIVAHRLSTLAICDRILVLQEGRLDALGPASTLAHSSEYYKFVAGLSRSGVIATGSGASAPSERH